MNDFGLSHCMQIAKTGFDTWAGKDHNRRWFRKIDHTPIPNDLTVNIAEAFRDAIEASPRVALPTAQRVPDELRALSEKATPGPWQHVVGDNYHIEATSYPMQYPHHCKSDDTGPYLAYIATAGNRTQDFGEANSRLIVAAVNRLREEIARAAVSSSTAPGQEEGK